MVRLIIILVVLMCGFIEHKGAVTKKFEVGKPQPRIVTPTSKVVRIEVFSLEMIAPQGCIYDITGREIAKMEAEGDIAQDSYVLKWRPSPNIPTGVYIYQLEGQGQIYNGTIVVAR